MSEIVEDVIDGFLCQECLSVMPDHQSPGYPRTCKDCRKSATNFNPHHHVSKVKCPTCGKLVKAAGLPDHQRDVHNL